MPPATASVLPRDRDEPRTLYEALAPAPSHPATRDSIESALDAAGLLWKDPRLASLRSALLSIPAGGELGIELLGPVLAGPSRTLLDRAVKGDLAIPDFGNFRAKLTAIFEDVRPVSDGDVAAYIPQLARVDPGRYAMAVCTIDGQQFSVGDDREPYCVQSTCKPINYAITLDALGEAAVHAHVGREPSGRSFNEITLNGRGLPHNPLINAGAIMCASLIAPEKSPADRFDSVLQTWRRLTGGGCVGFDNAVFLSERDTADRNFALAYFMRENGAFPPGTDLRAALDLYLQCCSITVDVRAMAVVASTFANGGICPLTDERVLGRSSVKNCLSLMASCGMYDFSGEFAFTVGLPAKSGVSGALFITVPGVCGIALWSPRLDALGNSVRGVEFSRRLTQTFPFHTFSGVLAGEGLPDPRRTATERFIDEAVHLCAAASRDDVQELRKLVARQANVNSADYDGRTPLHLAASEGRLAATRFLLSCGADASLTDRWGNTPKDDALRSGHDALVALIQAQGHEAEAAPAANQPHLG